jgi:hypothetical protein
VGPRGLASDCSRCESRRGPATWGPSHRAKGDVAPGKENSVRGRGSAIGFRYSDGERKSREWLHDACQARFAARRTELAHHASVERDVWGVALRVTASPRTATPARVHEARAGADASSAAASTRGRSAACGRTRWAEPGGLGVEPRRSSLQRSHASACEARLLVQPSRRQAGTRTSALRSRRCARGQQSPRGTSRRPRAQGRRL